jgi:GNAT superfamily N-acetyltransferase
VNLEIARAMEGDIPVLLRLIREMATYERVPDVVEIDETRARRYLFGEHALAEAWIARLGGAPAGYAILFATFSSFRGLPNLYIEDVFVREEARGKGIGLAFMRHFAKLALERGCRRLTWSVLDWNEPALEFYRKLNAERETGRIHFDLTGDALRALAAG